MTASVANSNLVWQTSGSVSNNGQIAMTAGVGDLILVMAYGPAASGPWTISDGTNTYVAATGQPFEETSNFTEMSVWWVLSNAIANPTVTVTLGGSGNNFLMAYCDVTGQKATSPVDAQSGIGSVDATYLSNPVTTTAATDLVIAFAANDFSAAAYGVGAGYTIIQSVTANKNGAIATATPGTGSTNPLWTNADGTSGGTSFTIALLSALPQNVGGAPILLLGV